MSMLLGIILVLYAGLILGVSFIAAPAKFMVPGLPISIALEIGKTTFHLFIKVEWVLSLIAAVITFFSAANLHRWWFIGGLITLLLIEAVYILPILDTRLDRAIIENIANPNVFHWLYIGIDMLKIIIALAGAFWFLNNNPPNK